MWRVMPTEGSSLHATSETDDLIDEIVAGVAEDSVYVAEDVPNSDTTTEASLAARLQDGDGIVLVALPATAVDDLGDPQAFANELGDSLASSDVIVGLVVGDQGYTYSNYVPLTVTADLMDRAESVSTNPAELLGTYIRNVHSWQREQPVPVSEEAVPAIASVGGFALGGVLVVALVVLAVRPIRRRVAAYTRSLGRWAFVPRRLRQRLYALESYGSQIRDDDIRDAISGSVRSIESLFRDKSNRTQEIQIELDQKLSLVVTTLKTYERIQNDETHFVRAEELMSDGRDAVVEFREIVREMAISGNMQQLRDYHGATSVLNQDRDFRNL